MTSYLRFIFGGHSQQSSGPSGHSPAPPKSHNRSRSAPAPIPTPSYIYGPPSSATSSSNSNRLRTKRSNSYCARTTAPSPLRYGTYDSVPMQSGDARRTTPMKVERPALYRRASYKSAEPGLRHHSYAPSASFGGSSRSNSSSSLLPGMMPPPPPLSTTSSRSGVRYTETRPSLKQTHTWQSSISSASGSSQAYASDPRLASHPGPLHMHPLFATTRLHSAPISYDVLFAPSSRTALDRTTHTAVPAHTLAQPATDPPTLATSRIVLRSDKFPWPVIVTPSSLNPSSGSSFYLGSSKGGRSAALSNMDLLYSVHTTLLTRITPQEWEALGHGSRAQRKITRAYEKRCTKMGGGWEGGVRRVDWLHGKTRLIGIEAEKHGSAVGSGKLVFGKA